MNFNQWYKRNATWSPNAAEEGWKACKRNIIKLLESHKELESISHNGKKIYKIYGVVIDKIKKEI